MERCQVLVEAVLDLDKAPRNYLVKPDFSDELKEVRKDLDQVDAEIEDCHAQRNKEWSELSGQPEGQVRLELFSGTEWQFRLPKTNDQKILQAEMPHVQVHRTLKNGVYYFVLSQARKSDSCPNGNKTCCTNTTRSNVRL